VALDPDTREPLPPEAMGAMLSKRFAAAAMSTERWMEIPTPVRDVYRLWRPTPLIRARRLEAALETPAHIYFKYEGVSPVGSHKPNTAVAEAFYVKDEGAPGMATFTGAGQWGSALAMACHFFDLECHIYMVRVSYDQKPYRRILMEAYGANVVPSPSDTTEYGRKILAEHPDHPGSLGIAASEATHAVASMGRTLKMGAGSMLGPVLMHQTVVGLEALKQFELAGEYPDVVIGGSAAGSSFAGLAFPFLHQNFTAGRTTRFINVEPKAVPTLTKGVYALDYCDEGKTWPMMKTHTLGHSFVPPGIHAGGLRYHAQSPHVSALYEHGDIEAVAVGQRSTFEAALQFARAEGIIAAPESAHGIRGAIDEALRCRETGESKVIVFHLSGHGHFDLAAYDAYLKGALEDYDYPEAAVQEAIAQLP
jgi:tryptophan synthase beta chain